MEDSAISAVEFDFEARVERAVPIDDALASIKARKFVWFDLDFSDPKGARHKLSSLGLVSEEVMDAALHAEPATQHARYPDYIHLVLSGCRQRGEQFDLERTDVVIAENFLITIHRGPVVFLDAVRRSYRDDFVRFAKSPSFLVYELWDHLIENYLSVQKRMEERVEALQRQLIGEVDDSVFSKVSELGADLLHFRKVLLPARSVLVDLATRRTLFISEATQPYLANMGGTLEHVLQDLLVDRDILSESLDLYMSMVGHRTNEVMKRLTVVSVVFLPLTFLCGVYGMNFRVLPELEWQLGYVYFWAVVLAIVAGLLFTLRRAKML